MHPYYRFTRGKTGIPDGLANHLERKPVVRMKPEPGPAFIQTDPYRVDPFQLLEPPFHGMGAGRAVHAEDNLLDFQ